ncbi:recombinase family protein [Clostridium estertheticum]|nr:recombinase family protein [Clostridium estertheticum]
MKIGYAGYVTCLHNARVSTMEQSLDRQLDALKLAGAEEIIQDKITGTKADRPELNILLGKLRKGDVILISDLTRLSRSTKDLFSLVEQIEKKCTNIKSLKESWLDTTTPQGKLMFTFMAGISQFERDLIGVAYAKLIFRTLRKTQPYKSNYFTL